MEVVFLQFGGRRDRNTSNPGLAQRMLLTTDMNDVEQSVLDRYSAGAQACEQSLCCATSYDASLLEAIPAEVIERDYGCGDPSRYLQRDEVVLDLGSGSGKHCFIAAQVVGPNGRVVGIDMNDDMLELARGAAPEVARRIGYANVEFHRSKIQDLSDCVADQSIDVITSNCVLNLVRPEDKKQLFREIHRVLRDGGRAVISDIVSNTDIPEHMQRDPELWSGCISGAFRQDEFIAAFAEVGLCGIEILERSHDPWQTVEGIEFRSITVRAHKTAVEQTKGCCQ
jgi:SAM-dependent methyltransferase